MTDAAPFLGSQGFARRINLRAGPVVAGFEPDSGFLRHIRAGGHEVLRGIYAVVRDHNWGTVATRLRDLKVTQGEDWFEVAFTAICRQDGIAFDWRGTISGRADGTIRYGFDGIAQSGFRRNRIGFCILHPVAVAGTPCRIQTAAGETRETAFPDAISPQQPFLDLRAIEHQVGPGLAARAEMEGDVFETEDQRNWSDASFKTYCTPLSRPYPARVEAGECIVQAVTLAVSPVPALTVAAPSVIASQARVAIAFGSVAGKLPSLGLGAASHGQAPDRVQIDRLRVLRPAHLRVDLVPSDPGGADALARGLGQAGTLGTRVEVALHLGADPEIELSAIAEMAGADAPVARWLALSRTAAVTPDGLVPMARRHLTAVAPRAAFGAGTDAFFTELNRDPPRPGQADFVFFSLNPQVHAFDNASIVETLEAQPQMLHDARRIANGRPVAVTPVTLRPRGAPSPTDDEANGTALPPDVDPRQATLFAAGWTLGTIAALADADSLTLFQTTGWRGVMDGPGIRRDLFPVAEGGVFPVYHLLADLGEFVGADVLSVRLDDPRGVACLALRAGDRLRVLVANLTPRPLTATLDRAPFRDGVRITMLDDRTLPQAMRQPEAFRQLSGLSVQGGPLDIALGPCAIARIDGVAA